MKKINKGQFRFILFLSLFLTLSFSCQRVMDDGEEDDVSSSDGTALKIMARSGGNTSIEYPVYLYAFNEKGDCAAKQKITSEEVEMNLQLPSGNFKVVALSGVSKGYVMSDNPKISDVITMQEGGCASKAMMMGMAVHADGEKTVINFYEHSDSDVIAEDLVEAYNASQDKVEVKLSLISNDDYDDKVKVMLA